MMVFGVTCAPGSTRMRTTVASVWAGISSIESSRGTRLPVDERTWRTSGPRFTVSVQMVERSTVGAAGLSRDTAITASTATTTTADAGPYQQPALLLLLNVWASDIHRSKKEQTACQIQMLRAR